VSKYPIPFGRHLLLERINVGGMAEVFKAKAFGVEGFERIVAVKRILPTLADDDEFITMFIDEARIAAHLTHQNIVQIFELGRADKTFFISMEYVAGHDLRLILDHQKKTKRPLEITKSCFIVSRVAEALEYAHRKRDPAGRDLKIIHRDVTPQNIIISFEGEVKLCDFGIAKAASRASRTQVGVLKGKFAYMSPEQVRGQPTDRRGDIFALGVIFYEMLTGERLFLGESDYATLDAVRLAVIEPPTKFNPQISPELEAIMLKMLARDPKERYQWASEVHEDLLDHLTPAGKRPYHGRHLRAWMQESYARDVEVENAKLEEFMRVKAPANLGEDDELDVGPAAAVAELAEKSVASDPADRPRNRELPDHSDATDAIPALSSKERSPVAKRAPPGPTSSPVANLFGAPELASAAAEEASPGDLMVSPTARKASVPTSRLEPDLEEPSSDAERTQFDVVVGPGLGEANETLFDEERSSDSITQSGVHESEISAAQAELLERLGQAGALPDTGDTVDAEDLPQMRGPSQADGSANDTLHGDDDDDEPPGEDTPLGDAPTLIRTGSGPGGAAGGFENEGTREERKRGGPRSGDVVVQSSPSTADLPSRNRARRVNERGRAEGSGWGPAPPGRATPSEAVRVTPVLEPTPPPMVEPPSPYGPLPFEGTPPNGAARPSPEASAPGIAKKPPLNLQSPRMVMVMAGGIALLAAMALGFVLVSLGPSSASLEISTAPVTAVEVRVDGNLVATQTPATIEPLTIGKHQVELSAVGYRSHSQMIHIEQAKPHTMIVPLDAELPPTPVPAREPEDDVEPPAGDAPVPKLERKIVAPPPQDPPPAKAEAPPPPVKSEPPAIAKPQPVIAKAAPPVVERAAPKPRPKPQGSLLVSTTPQGVAVTIDGKATGLKTPIRQPHALAAGKHVITFVMDDGKTYNFDVVINEGETTKLIKPLR
jgi:eukaryotic-like serine/threonine-protein kinase